MYVTFYERNQTEVSDNKRYGVSCVDLKNLRIRDITNAEVSGG